MKNILVFFFLTATLNILSAQGFSNDFLAIGVGARAQAMGKSLVASTNDVTAGYWNPAGLIRNQHDGWQFGAMHSELFAGVGKFDYLAATKKVADKRRAISLSVIRFGIDDIPNTLNLLDENGNVNFDNVVPFSATDYALIGGYSQYLFKDSEKWTVGGNMKIIYRNVGPFANAFGFGLDAGIQHWGKKWRFGLNVTDITGTFNAWTFNFTEDEKDILESTGNDLPENSIEVTKPRATLGIARYSPLAKGFGLLVETNIEVTSDTRRNTLIASDRISASPSIGMEVDYKQFAFLRFGLTNLQEDVDLGVESSFWTIDPSLGVGVKIKDFTLDYAFTDVGEQRSFSHVISLFYNLKGKKSVSGF